MYFRLRAGGEQVECLQWLLYVDYNSRRVIKKSVELPSGVLDSFELSREGYTPNQSSLTHMQELPSHFSITKSMPEARLVVVGHCGQSG